MKESIIQVKSFDFALKIIRLSRLLIQEKKEYVLSNQIMRSGTSIGAMVREAEHAESRKDFIHKFSIALKEANETVYWLELLAKSEISNDDETCSLFSDAKELIRIMVSIIKSSKSKKEQ